MIAATKATKTKQARAERLREAGLCVICGKDARGQRHCGECKRKRSALAKTYRQRRLDKGICVRCKAKPVPGLTLCEKHRDRASGNYIRYVKPLKDERTAAGLCVRCGGERIPPFRLCPGCRKIKRDEANEWYHKNKAKRPRLPEPKPVLKFPLFPDGCEFRDGPLPDCVKPFVTIAPEYDNDDRLKFLGLGLVGDEAERYRECRRLREQGIFPNEACVANGEQQSRSARRARY